MNIITHFDRDTLAYPIFSASDTIRQVDFITVGDSYYWIMQLDMSPLLFRNCRFWYYFNNIYQYYLPTIESEMAHARIKEILLHQNVVCIMQTDAGLGNFGFDFAEQANAAFKGHQ